MISERRGLFALMLGGLVLGAASVAPAQEPDEAEPPPLVLTFDRASVRPHMRFLRLRELEGRRTGERGAEIAVRYIASMLEVLGVEPAGVGGSYFQDVPVVRRRFNPTAFVRVRGDRRTE